MNEELDKILCEKYPKIFRDRNKRMQETCMCWGFSHGDGWYNIIEAACRNIQNHTDWKRKQEPYASMSEEEFDEIHQPIAAQVKEKFGGLRFYVDNADDYTSGVIAMAESMSYKTCETCGAPGKQSGKGWIKTVCESCNKTKEV
jgi:NADH pyrophosphatase NudC (nudix superfamily)